MALDYSGGDVSNVFLPNYSADTITAELPTNFLRQGTNELALTANDDPADRDRRRHAASLAQGAFRRITRGE